MLATQSRKWHKWLFLFLGIQMLFWMVGGLYMVSVPLTIIHGDHLITDEQPFPQHTPPEVADLVGVLERMDNVIQLGSAPQMGPSVLEVERLDKTVLFDFEKDELVEPPNQEDIVRISRATFLRQDASVSVDLLEKPISELQGRQLPLWRARFSGPFDPTFYFSPDTGELVSRRHDLWRFFDFVWMFHIMDYEERQDVNNTFLRVSAGVSLIAVIAGLVLVYFTLRKNKGAPKQFKSGVVASIHKWLGLVIGAQILIWVSTGFGMSLIPKDSVTPDRMVARNAPEPLKPGDVGSDVAVIDAFEPGVKWTMKNLHGAPVFVLEKDGAVKVFGAKTGDLAQVNEATARRIASSLYAGSADIKTMSFLSRPGVENRTFTGPAWRADFSDKPGTTFYISAQSGELQASRNNSWRVFDMLWMLHMMDYPRTNSFNSPWIIMSGLLSLLIGVSGVILLIKAFTLSDFVPAFARPTRSLTVEQSNPMIDALHITARQGDNLLRALQKNRIRIASSCGGGGTCGQCVVEVSSRDGSLSAAERRHLTGSELENGKRLACQRRIRRDDHVIIPPPLMFVDATVLENRKLSEGMQEIIVRLPEPEHHEAGQHRFFDVPSYRLDPEDYQIATGEGRRRRFANPTPVTRSYSMSAPSGEAAHVNSFIVRKMPPGAKGGPPGVGSTFLCSRRPGDVISVSEPRGTFTICDGEGPVILIGGGAGMAPLRAMTLDLLIQKNDQRRIAFFYGARTENDLIYRDEMQNLAANHANFSFHCALSESDQNAARLPMCFIHEAADIHLRSDEGRTALQFAKFYLCGPPAMLAATKSMLEELGVSSERVFIDDFGI
ncbi:MAG: hypothetical protein DHS20C05_14400 [Hyphococcus sp.]|nr:MAG: hypothetical protein DHS20C05_14400 [Marinicaulis sp.]